MNDKRKQAPAAAREAAQAPERLIPRTAPKAASESPPATGAAPPAKAAAKPRAPRRPTEVEQTVAKHRKVLADALVMAQAINYDLPKVMKQETGKPPKSAKPGKPAKTTKIKLVRDSYAMPEAEYARLGELKRHLATFGKEVKKSELLRAGVALLAALNDTELKAVMGRVERIKTGRPKK